MRTVRLRREPAGFEAAIPAVQALARTPLELDAPVTFLAGDNGTGKSTLIEAIAVACGFNAEGGGGTIRFTTRASHSGLHRDLVVGRGRPKPLNGFFLRAESFFNVASAAEGNALEADVYHRPLHEQSHGESFIDLVMNRFAPNGLYILDEPEAALSVHGNLALMHRMHELVEQGSQFVISTHSPILLGFPGAAIYELGDDGFARVEYDDAAAVQLTRSFLADRDRFLHHLLGR